MKNTLILISSLIIMIAITGCSSKQKNAEQQSDKKQLIGMAESAPLVYKNVSMTGNNLSRKRRKSPAQQKSTYPDLLPQRPPKQNRRPKTAGFRLHKSDRVRRHPGL